MCVVLLLSRRSLARRLKKQQLATPVRVFSKKREGGEGGREGGREGGWQRERKDRKKGLGLVCVGTTKRYNLIFGRLDVEERNERTTAINYVIPREEIDTDTGTGERKGKKGSKSRGILLIFLCWSVFSYLPFAPAVFLLSFLSSLLTALLLLFVVVGLMCISGVHVCEREVNYRHD